MSWLVYGIHQPSLKLLGNGSPLGLRPCRELTSTLRLLLYNPTHIYAINPDLRFAFPNATIDGAVEQTFRLIVKPDLFGEHYRLRLSNFFGTQAVTFKAISVAVQDHAGNIIPGTLRKVTFGHADTLTIQPGKLVYSDGFRQTPGNP